MRTSPYNLPPRPRGYPIIGNMIEMVKHQADFNQWCKELAKEYGPIYRLTFLFKDTVIVNNAEYAQKAMVDTGTNLAGRLQVPTIAAFSDNYSDITMADADQPSWKARRKLLATAVKNFTVGRAYERRVEEALYVLMNHLDNYAEKKESFDPEDYCKLFTYNHIANMCFKKTYEFDDPEFLYLRTSFDDVSEVFSNFLHESDILPFVTPLLPFDLPDVKKIKRLKGNLIEFIKREVTNKKENYDDTCIEDLTTYVLKLREETKNEEGMADVTDLHILHLIANIFAAGVDTTQMQLRWLLGILAQFPNVQEKIRKEIDDFVNGDTKFISALDYRNKMPYSEAVVLEATRFGTVAQISLPHKALCDVKIGEYDIPKGSVVLLNQWVLHHDETQFDDPDDFKPERFLTNDGKLGHRPKSYMPFGVGRRACPGEFAARNTIWLSMVAIVRRYKLLPPVGKELKMEYKSPINGSPKPFKIILERI